MRFISREVLASVSQILDDLTVCLKLHSQVGTLVELVYEVNEVRNIFVSLTLLCHASVAGDNPTHSLSNFIG